MHEHIYATFESILEERDISGRVLELGVAGKQELLLDSEAPPAKSERIGIGLEDNPDIEYEYRQMNANDMTGFDEDSAGCILCNAMIEHDKHFWKTLAEISRVGRPGCLVVIGAPGFAERDYSRRLPGPVRRVYRRLARAISRLVENTSEGRIQPHKMTPVYNIHLAPHDYYRFSEYAFRDVILAGLEATEVRTVMDPPRIIGCGRVPEEN